MEMHDPNPLFRSNQTTISTTLNTNSGLGMAIHSPQKFAPQKDETPMEVCDLQIQDGIQNMDYLKPLAFGSVDISWWFNNYNPRFIFLVYSFWIITCTDYLLSQ